MDTGGKVIILLGEGGEQEFNTNINFFLEEYGMTINNGKSYVTVTEINVPKIIQISS